MHSIVCFINVLKYEYFYKLLAINVEHFYISLLIGYFIGILSYNWFRLGNYETVLCASAVSIQIVNLCNYLMSLILELDFEFMLNLLAFYKFFHCEYFECSMRILYSNLQYVIWNGSKIPFIIQKIFDILWYIKLYFYTVCVNRVLKWSVALI